MSGLSGLNLGGGEALDVDLNLAPVIDCLTVLITFLLVSMSFISIGVLEAGVASYSPESAATTDPRQDVSLSVRLGAQGAWTVAVTGKTNETIPVPAWADGHRDYEGLKSALEKVRGRWPGVAEASVTADPSIEYREIVQAIEAVRKEIPKVYVGN